ncbi:mycothione reductase [Candidatus Poriferisodalis sp.]|uniref:mycothione reductase n=1 Tax=Candidatus Poriferisodalis sp. TaxID=3101277 RepID=UPI003B01691E
MPSESGAGEAGGTAATGEAGDTGEFDLVIVGSGSANSIPGPEFDDWSIALVERGVFGGTCLNVGCIPSKMLVYAADVVDTVETAGVYGISASAQGADWPAIRDRVFERIDPIAQAGKEYRHGAECPNVCVYEGEARFIGDRELDVRLNDGGTARVRGRHVVLGAGARPFIPPFPGLDRSPYHTSDTVMRLEELPERMMVLGGGYIAAELGYVFAALGVEVMLVNRSERLLRAEDDDVSEAFTRAAAQRFDLRLGATVTNVRPMPDGVLVEFATSTSRGHGNVDVLLVATGRMPNGDLLNLEAGAVAHERGRVLVDEHFRTSAPGVWSFGDLASEIQLKHLANAQVRALRHNLLVAEGQAEGPMRSVCERFVPHAVFSHPQVASVGLTERAARAGGLPVSVAIKPYGDTAYGWAMEDSTSFVKLIAHAQTRELLGAHIIGPQASTLIQPLISGMTFGQTVDQMAHDQFYIHPALTEVVENALLDL